MNILGGRGAVFWAIALGALTSFLAWRYVDQASQQATQKVEMTPVVVANVHIPARSVITPDLVRVQQVPAETAHVQAVHSLDEVVGKVARTELVADEAILSSRLYLQRGESGLAFMIPDGMRAISVGFTELIGSGGMVVPGDHVDVIGIFDARGPIATPSPTPGSAPVATQTADPKADQNTTLATIVLQNVQVLAVAQHLEGEDAGAKKDQGGLSVPGAQSQQPPASQQRAEPPAQPGAKTATLALSPQDALKMVLAEEKGRIRLALRRINDKSTPNVPQVPMTVLLTPPTASASAQAPAQ